MKIYSDDFRQDNTDILFILDKDKPVSYEEAYEKLGLEYMLYDWDNNKRQWIKVRDSGILKLHDWENDALVFDGKEFRYITTVADRVKYAFASLRDDKLVEDILKQKMSEIEDVKITSLRATTKPFLKYWMWKYDFTLEDFIFNDKYIILSDHPWRHKIYELDDLGLLNWDHIAICSEESEDKR